MESVTPASAASVKKRTTSAAPPELSCQEKMVCWYDPRQLIQTGIDVAISTIFGRHSDYRLLEAVAANKRQLYYDHSNGSELWIDYAADVGDGFNSTYAVGYWMTRPTLRGWNGSEQTRSGEILIFGGDEVYPTASRRRYERRLVAPYTAALEQSQEPRFLYAIPGNHDWYDSLASFSRLFCSGRSFAAWQTQQNRSYFAIKLPHRWWLLGTDVQLDSDIDAPQVEYFKRVCEEMKQGDSVILCTAEPHWVETAMYGDDDPEITENNLRFLEKRILEKADVKVFIAGDLHHYRRHEGPGRRQKITAGGGGAFLHPTYGPRPRKVKHLPDGFNEQSCYPSRKRSLALCMLNLFFPLFNPLFGLLAGPVYLLLASAFALDNAKPRELQEFGQVMRIAATNALLSPIAILAVVLGFVFFTDTHSILYRVIAGSIHALAHLAAALTLGWASSTLSWKIGANPQQLYGRCFTILFMIATGWIAGSLVMGLYLLISLAIFRRHYNEAFSSLAIQDYKNFLRLHITEKGLTIYPYGIRKVPRRWKPAATPPACAAKLEPDGSKNSFTEPHLIETPIEVPGSSEPLSPR